jgi:hypothetical protein
VKKIASLAKAAARECMMLFAALVVVTWAGAGEAAQAREQRPCDDDVAKYCKDIQPGRGRIARCLKQHEQELSPACKQHAAEVKRKGQEFRAACEDDVLRLCGDVKAGGGRILHCLKQHEQELTPDCKATMQQKKATGK